LKKESNTDIRDFWKRIRKIQEGLPVWILGNDEEVFPLKDNHNNFNECKNQFRYLSNLWMVSDVGRAKIYRAEPSIYDLSCNKFQIAVEYMEKYKILNISQIADRTISSGSYSNSF
jgi:hypothetical protein